MRGDLLPDFHGRLVIRLEEVIGAVIFDGLPAVLSNVEDCRDTNMNAMSPREKHDSVLSGKLIKGALRLVV